MKNINLDSLDILSIGDTIQLVGAIYAGEGKTFLCFFPEEEELDELVNLQMPLEDWKKFLRQTDLLEVECLAQSPNGELFKAITRKSQRQIDLHVAWFCFRRDEYTCCYCGKNNLPLTVDHLIRWEEGGPTVSSNLLSCCKKCNKTRGKMDYADWLESRAYAKLSANLPNDRKEANIALASTLDSIERVVNIRSR